MRRFPLLPLFALLVACKAKGELTASPDAALLASASPVSSAAAPPPPAYDPIGTTKAGAGVTVQYLTSDIGNDAEGHYVILGFQLRNDADAEKPVSVLALEVASLGGQRGKVNVRKSKCTGHVPPHGQFQCLALVDFDDDAPKEVNARVEGAWFRLRLEQHDLRDASH